MADINIAIAASDAKAKPVMERTNSLLAKMEQVATKAYGGIRTGAEAVGNALSRAATRLNAFLESHQELAKSTLQMIALAAAHERNSFSIGNMTAAYRAARFAFSPTLFTGLAVGVGVAAQSLIKMTLAQAELVGVHARQSVFLQQSFEDYRLLSLSLGKLGLDTREYVGAGKSMQAQLDALSSDGLKPFGIDLELLRARGLKSADMLREIGSAAEGLNEFEKARLAVKLFGTEAEKNIGLLDGRVQRVRESFIAWGGKLTELEATELMQFKQGVDSVGDSFGRMRDNASGAIDGIRARLSVLVAELSIDLFKRGDKMPGFMSAQAVNSLTAPSKDLDEAQLRALVEELNRTTGAALSPKFASLGGKESADLARQFKDSLPGLQDSLSKATAARKAALDLVGTPEGNLKGLGLAQELVRSQREVDTLTGKIKGLQKAESDAEAARREREKGIQKAREIMAQRAAGGFRVDVIKDLEEKPANKFYEEQFRAAQKVSADTLEMELGNLKEQFAQEDVFAQASRDRQLARAEDFHARTLDQKIAVEEKKAEIEREYLGKTYAIKAALLQADQDLELSKAEQSAELRAAINEKYALAGRDLTLRTEAAMAAANDTAAIKSGQLIQDQAQKNFDSVKHAAEGLFDTLILRTKSWGDFLKNAVLLPALTLFKQLASTAIAGALTGGRGGSSASGIGGLLGGLLGGGGIARAGAPGGTGGFAGPVGGLSGMLGMGGGLGGGGGIGGLGGMLGLNAGALGLGGAGLGLFGAFKAGQSDSKIMKGLAPGIGAVSGLVGFGALASMFPALIAAGPAGWIAAAGIGAAIGLIGVFKKRGEDKIVEKVKSTYGIAIDRGFARSPLAEIIKNQFGGDIDLGIRSPMVRELLSVYRMQSNQAGTGVGLSALNNMARGVSLSGSGGSVYQNPVNVNGGAYGYGGSLPTSGPAQPFQAAQRPIVIENRLQIDGRDVQASVQRTNQASNGRRESAAVLTDPLLIFG